MQASQAEVGKASKALSAQKDKAKLNEAAQEFEAVFIAEMMKPMFEGISTDGEFGGGKGEEVFRSLLIQEYGKIISQSGGMGFSDQIREEMIRMQEQAG
ncbi:MAG: rod-binding protein [Alphaproteobacteria bacterium]|nr:rod-binding protein [Alphaproteobacteria bacterium]